MEYLVSEIITTGQIASCDLNVALAVHSKLHDCDSAEIFEAPPRVLPINNIKLWHMPLNFSQCSAKIAISYISS